MMLWEARYDPASPMPAFTELVSAWAGSDKRVFVLRANGPIGNVREYFDSHFFALGTPVPLAEDVTMGDRDNQRTEEVWMEVRYDPKHPDAYRHSLNAQPLHTDGSYIPEFPNATLMACVTNAGEGGETTFISSNTLADVMRIEAPELLDALSNMDMPHSRSGDERIEKVLDMSADAVLVNWNYYCLAKDLSPEMRRIAEAFFDFLQKSPGVSANTLAVKLSPGDAITWKDRQILHGRNGFKATKESERFLWKCAIDIGRFN
jgi:alpha-ketoglutarate-dependent taurine dioxygenase